MKDPRLLITDLYDAALDETRWGNVMKRLEDVFDGFTSALHLTGPSAGQIHQSEFDPGVTHLYNDHFWSKDPWLAKGRDLKPGAVATGATLCPVTEMEADYRGCIITPSQIHDLICVKASLAPGWDAYISVYRKTGSDYFNRSDMAHMATVAGHITRAVRIRETLAAQTAAVWHIDEALYQLPFPLVMVDAALVIVWANRCAEALIRRQDSRGGSGRARLTWGTPDEQSALAAAVGQATQTSHGSSLTLHINPLENPLLIDVIPLGQYFEDHATSSFLPVAAHRRCLLVAREKTGPDRRVTRGNNTSP